MDEFTKENMEKTLAEHVAEANRIVYPQRNNSSNSFRNSAVSRGRAGTIDVKEEPTMLPLALTPKQAASLTPLGENGIRKRANDDPLFPAFKNGADIVIPTRAFEEWLCEQAANRYGFKECEIPYEKGKPNSKYRQRRAG